MLRKFADISSLFSFILAVMLPQPGEQSDATAEDNQCKGEKHGLSKQKNKHTDNQNPQNLDILEGGGGC